MKLIKNTLILFAAAAILSSCLKDLDTKPLNSTDFTSESAYENVDNYLSSLAYINGYYMLVGQDDPGQNDLGFSDSGQSEFLRQWFNLNEMSCDALKCVWGDSYLTELQHDSWGGGTNDALVAVYTRAVKAIALANEYLLQTTDEKLAARGQSEYKDMIAGYRAEARFHRAMFFYVLMDEFGNPPFPTPENIQNATSPEQIKRADLFKWLETELLELGAENSAMPEKGAVPYPRPTKGSVWALLSRMYLNAEVYTGTARWQEAKDASKKVIEMGYTIHTPYSDLFRQDNTTNGAADEFIFAIAYDNVSTQSWGGSTTFVSASLDEDSNLLLGKELLGTENAKINAENWAGYHVPADYVARFELKNVEWGNEDNVFGYDREKSDKRAFFINNGAKEDFDASLLNTGWLCWKWCGLDSNNRFAQEEKGNPGNFKLSSADMPVFRLAEIYLNYAEADARLNGGNVRDELAKNYLKELRDRAGVTMPLDVDLDWLLDERARELMWEGHRRVDLIRYGYFTSQSFPWTLKGGILNGKVSIPEYKTIYPLIQSDLSSNRNLHQNFGY